MQYINFHPKLSCTLFLQFLHIWLKYAPTYFLIIEEFSTSWLHPMWQITSSYLGTNRRSFSYNTTFLGHWKKKRIAWKLYILQFQKMKCGVWTENTQESTQLKPPCVGITATCVSFKQISLGVWKFLVTSFQHVHLMWLLHKNRDSSHKFTFNSFLFSMPIIISPPLVTSRKFFISYLAFKFSERCLAPLHLAPLRSPSPEHSLICICSSTFTLFTPRFLEFFSSYSFGSSQGQTFVKESAESYRYGLISDRFLFHESTVFSIPFPQARDFADIFL